MIMSFNFNWSLVSGGAPYITISALGVSFNNAAVIKLGNPEKVILGFDEANLVLGIKPYAGEPSKPYEFAGRVRNGWIRIGCRDFVKYLERLANMDFSTAKKFIAEMDAESGILIVDIKRGNENATE